MPVVAQTTWGKIATLALFCNVAMVEAMHSNVKQQLANQRLERVASSTEQRSLEELRSSVSVHLKRWVVEVPSVTLRGNEVVAQKKQMFFGDISVGHPAQTFVVVYDTGSGNLVIPSSECRSAACDSHSRFDPRKSSAQSIECSPGWGDDQVQIDFGTGYVTGDCFEDTVCIGGACARAGFIAATEESPVPFDEFHFDGVLGLAMPAMAQGANFSVFKHLSRNLKTPMFSVFLSYADQEPSEVTFGGVRPEHVASDLFWADASPRSGYWEVQAEDIAIDNVAQNLCRDNDACRVAVDTGTSQLAGPSHLMAWLRGKLAVHRDCSNYDGLPKLGFIVSGRILTLLPEDYVDNINGFCEVSLMDMDVPPPNGPLFIFGIPLLQRYYSVYDLVHSRVGFAVAKHAGREVEPLLFATDAGVEVKM